MIVASSDGRVEPDRVVHVTGEAELERELHKRGMSGLNEFRLVHECDEVVGYPSLLILVNGDLAFLSYASSGERASYSSIGEKQDVTGESHFIIAGPQDECIPNKEVVPLAVAVRAAKEFLNNPAEPPECLLWFDGDTGTIIGSSQIT